MLYDQVWFEVAAVRGNGVDRCVAWKQEMEAEGRE
jgi:hypothetical protein